MFGYFAGAIVVGQISFAEVLWERMRPSANKFLNVILAPDDKHLFVLQYFRNEVMLCLDLAPELGERVDHWVKLPPQLPARLSQHGGYIL